MLDLVSRRVENAVPVTEARREKLRSKRSVATLLNCFIVGFLLLWLAGGIYYILNVFTQPLVPGSVKQTKVLIAQIANANNTDSRRRRKKQGLGAHREILVDSKPGQFHGLLGVRNLQAKLPESQHPVWISSLKYPLDREVSDYRISQCKQKSYPEVFSSGQKVSVIFIFCNEMLELLLRSVHSVLNNSPPELLHEIILVDDGSDKDYIKDRSRGGNGHLEDYVALLPKARLVRTNQRSGIVRARTLGVEEAEGDIFVILDSHIETQPGWLEPLMKPIVEDKTTVVMPHIDGIDKVTWKPQQGGVGCTLGIIWKVMEHAFTPNRDSPEDRRNAKPGDYVSSPTMAGGLFAANKAFFQQLGGYDMAMSGWGAENVEFSFRLWQCGGKLLCTECSRVYHMFGGGKHYSTVGTSTSVNRIRTMGAWMDDFGDLAWHVNGKIPFNQLGDMSAVFDIRKKLKCKSFQWFLDNIWPESDVRDLAKDVPYMGPLKNAKSGVCWPAGFRGQSRPPLRKCRGGDTAFIHFKRTGRITPETNDESCLLHNGKWDWCYYFDLAQWDIREIDSELKTTEMSVLWNMTKTMSSSEEKLWFPWEGEKVLVQIMNPNSNECVAAVPKGGNHPTDKEMGTSKCDVNDLDQIWLWSRYKVDPFWKSLRMKHGVKV